MKIYISPSAKQVRNDTGIGQVIHAQAKYLAQYLVSDPRKADVIACHINQNDMPRVDVLHLHGLYWTGDGGLYTNDHRYINKQIAMAARKAKIITTPSEWVAMPFKRDMRIIPEIIGHGINVDEWTPGKGDYILWNKNRASDVCDPTPAEELARRGFKVTSTFGKEGKLNVVGTMPFEKMKVLVQNASIYLATTMETFGIGTLEALASGVPVIGYDWGGTRDIVGEAGILVEPGDIAALCQAAKSINQTHRMAARERARLFSWENVMQKYLDVYERSLIPANNKTCIVITNYNYSEWIAQTIESALAAKPDEIIVVDDGSTDNSREIIAKYPVRMIFQENQGVAAARNNAIRATDCDFITCLDADDMIAMPFVKVLSGYLKDNPDCGIAYSGLQLLWYTGEVSGSNWPPEFDFNIMANPSNPPSNCIPSCCMFRREMWRRSGGYKQEFAPGEDAEFWVRGLATGFTGKRVTQDGLFIYRLHNDSESRKNQYKFIDKYHPWMRDHQYPLAAPYSDLSEVRSYSNPIVSVIIPVGSNHTVIVKDAIESMLGQTMREWELIVVNDSGKELDIPEYPFARVFKTAMEGAGKARNVGIDAAKAPFVLFLDADDQIEPTTLAKMLASYNDKYVYTDWKDEKGVIDRLPEYDVNNWQGQHAVTVLMPTEWARDIKFDETLISWEDWDFFIRCAIAGYHGQRLPEPLLIYRTQTGTRRKVAHENENKLKSLLRERYSDYYTGVKKMACCGSTPKRAASAVKDAKRLIYNNPEKEPAQPVFTPDSGTIRMEYIGQSKGAVTYTVKGTAYRGGNNTVHKYINAQPEHVQTLLDMGIWAVVREPQKPEPVVQPEPVVEEPVKEPDVELIPMVNLVEPEEHEEAPVFDLEIREVTPVEHERFDLKQALKPLEEKKRGRPKSN